jgi:hypothetical protein
LRYIFEWDSVKAKQNIYKHKVSFPRAAKIFHDPDAISIFDEEHSQEEDRWVTMGRGENGVLVVVNHTFSRIDESSCTIRIISARKATKREMKQYEVG